MSLDRYVDVNIQYDVQTVTREGFGTLLFITEDATFTPGTVSGPYASIDEVDDDYNTTSVPREAAAIAFAQDNGFRNLKIAHKDPLQSWVQAISDLADTDNDWYAIAIDSRAVADVQDVAGETESRQKLFLGVVDEAAVLDGQDATDIASVLLDMNMGRTGVIFKRDAADPVWPEMAWFGYMLPEDPGTQNWAYRPLTGIATDAFTSGELSALEAKRANSFRSIAGNSVMVFGYTSEPGIFLDLVRGRDWLARRLQEDFIARQTSINPIPYRSPGPEIIESIIRQRLSIAADRGIILDDFEISVPAARDQQATDRANRHFPGVTFTANIVGWANTLQISGTLVV